MFSKVSAVLHRFKLKINVGQHKIKKKNQLQIQQVDSDILPSTHSAASLDYQLSLIYIINVFFSKKILPFVVESES